MKKFLHVGCGTSNHTRLYNIFPEGEWEETRLDIDVQVKPDIVGDITKMTDVPDNAFDAVFSSHNLEHLYPHQVKEALAEFYRVLKPEGIAIVRVPNITEVAAEIAKGNLHGVLYTSPAGPICAIDILYGFRPSIEVGNTFIAHRTAFVPQSLGMAMEQVGFAKVIVRNDGFMYSMEAIGEKRK